MRKRWLTLALSCMLLLSTTIPARADIATLDQALDRWLSAYPNARLSATVSLKTLQPFTETTVQLFNNALKHMSLNVGLERDGQNAQTALQIAVDGNAQFTLTEREEGGAYSLQTSLLPNRTLTSQGLSTLDLLTATQTAESRILPPAPVAGTEKKEQPLNTSLVADAFSALSAVATLQKTYQTLTDGILPFATEKRANYNIKEIGAGKWSRIARLTPEQSEGLLTALRDVLASGMDETFRDELSQVTFDKGFIVALYQNSDKQDICVYLKGNLIYPDGEKRKLLWQWAFTSNGLKRKDIFKVEVSRQSGYTDTRIINANWTQESRSDLFSMAGKTEVTLKRAKVTDKSTVRVDLSGAQTEQQGMTCKGTVSQELAQTVGEDTVKETQTAEVNLLLTPDVTGAVLSGTVNHQRTLDKAVQTEMLLTLAEQAPTVDATIPAVTFAATGAGTTVAPTATPTPTATENVTSSLDLIDDSQTGAEPAATPAATDYLVGTQPIGLKSYTVPTGMTTIALDQATEHQRLALFGEIAQNLAAQLLRAISALPQEDTALLRDGMTEQDAAAFLAMLSEP